MYRSYTRKTHSTRCSRQGFIQYRWSGNLLPQIFTEPNLRWYNYDIAPPPPSPRQTTKQTNKQQQTNPPKQQHTHKPQLSQVFREPELRWYNCGVARKAIPKYLGNQTSGGIIMIGNQTSGGIIMIGTKPLVV